MPSNLIFLVTGLAGFFCTWGRTVLDGSFVALLKALHSNEPYIFPGTNSALRTVFTGVYWPIDFLVDTLVVFWWEVVDGSHPTVSAAALYFLFQYFSILTAVYTEGFRASHQAKWKFSPTMWVQIFQWTAFACTGSLWAAIFLNSSPLLTPKRPISERRSGATTSQMKMLTLPLALLLGYVLPALIMGLPSPGVVSNDFQQKAIAFWNFFPIWVAAVQKVLETVFAMLGIRDNAATTSKLEAQRSHLKALRVTNLFAVALSTVSHWVFLVIGISTSLFPMIFAKDYAEFFSLRQTFVPPIEVEPVNTIGDCARSFVLWDQAFCYLVSISVMVYQLVVMAKVRNQQVGGFKATIGAVLSAVAIGPGATCLIASWIRDELLFATEDESRQRKLQ